ncbi:MAG TPA: FtsX-like permease family protein, partial [Pyrinomonadaceae bacterium]|nr:FtsX-like permease family protein [Pyrinomonadaceae bacterium]
TTVNLPVLVFTIGLTLLTAIVFGLVPALEASRFDLSEPLKESAKSVIGGTRAQRMRNAFVIAQVALALLLLVGAGLLLKSLNRLQSVEPGFDPNNLLTMRVSLPMRKYDTDPKLISFFKQAVDQIGSLPGVESVGAINTLPFDGPYSGTSLDIQGQPKRPPGHNLTTGVCVTDANYFQTMHISLKAGRLYTPQEVSEMRHVVVVNEAFARDIFPGQNAIGQRVTINMKDNINPPSEIIGIVGNNKARGLDSEVEPMAFWPHAELVYPAMTIAIRTRAESSSIAAAARNVVHQIDPEQPIGQVATMDSLMAQSVARARFNSTLLTIFSIVALVMAAVGIYGVMSYAVLQRTHEIGVRMALGAQRRDVLKLILRQGVLLALTGVLVGLAGSFGITRIISTLLFDVAATDRTTFAAVAIGLFAITFLASYLPAWRATKVNPLEALRYE